MTEQILADAEYTFDASAKTITLGAPYAALSLGQIVKIINITEQSVIYDSESIRNTITMSGAVITHVYDSDGMSDTDELQIVVNTGTDEKGHALVLTNSSAVALTSDTEMPDMYVITAGGAGDVYFYLPVNTTNVVELINAYFQTDTAVTLSVFLEVLAQGAANWQAVPAYLTGTYAADGSSQDMNGAYPLREFLGINNEYRFKCTVGGATDVGVKAMVVTK